MANALNAARTRHLIPAAAFPLWLRTPLQSQQYKTIETFGGALDTNWGEVWVLPLARGYEGTHAEDNGRFWLEFDRHVFVGFWAEDMADVRCDVEYMGSFYWGRLELGSSDTYPGLQMLWGYCGSGRADKVRCFRKRLPDGL